MIQRYYGGQTGDGCEHGLGLLVHEHLQLSDSVSEIHVNHLVRACKCQQKSATRRDDAIATD
jgi:hypothetical protein